MVKFFNFSYKMNKCMPETHFQRDFDGTEPFIEIAAPLSIEYWHYFQNKIA